MLNQALDTLAAVVIYGVTAIVCVLIGTIIYGMIVGVRTEMKKIEEKQA